MGGELRGSLFQAKGKRWYEVEGVVLTRGLPPAPPRRGFGSRLRRSLQSRAISCRRYAVLPFLGLYLWL